jgi:flagellar hook-basal body complex protein FliE
MNDIDVNRVLAQIRTLSAQAAGKPAAQAVPAATAAGFDKLIGGAINKVNDAQHASMQMQKAFELGDPSADLASVMIAQAKAQVSFKAMSEVRNRLVSAYQDIMNMPI